MGGAGDELRGGGLLGVAVADAARAVREQVRDGELEQRDECGAEECEEEEGEEGEAC